MQGLLGKKIGMTAVFDETGKQIAVTAIECGPCVIIQCKQKEKKGHDAVLIGFSKISEKHVNKPQLGVFKKRSIQPMRYCADFALEEQDKCKEGDIITASLFKDVSYVDITGITKGKGFQGVVRRYHMKGGPMTHGGHAKRRVGSSGVGTHAARVYKGKSMPGHMGAVQVTKQNLKVIQIFEDDNMILVGGSVPGPNGAIVRVNKARKRK